jgi:hypothetical protein
MPIFIPNAEISKNFSEMLNEYPVTPYLDNRDSFVKWIVFIHNKVNERLGKPSMTMDEAMDRYFQQMVPPVIFMQTKTEIRKYAVYISILFLLALTVYFLQR